MRKFTKPWGAIFGRRLIIAGLFALVGCGETFVALEPVITPENAVTVPDLEGHYKPHRRSGSGVGEDDEETSIMITRAQNGAPSNHYSVELRQKNSEPARADSVLIAPISGNHYLVQVPLPQKLEEDFRKRIKQTKLQSQTYYYLHVIRIFDSTKQGRFIDLRRPNEDGYRILSLLADRYGSEIVTERSRGVFVGSKTIFALGQPGAILRTISEAPHLRLETVTTVRKSESGPN